LQCIGLDVPASFTVSYTPLTNNISFGTSTFSFEAMSLLETREAAVPYYCWAAYGDEVAWVVSVNNGLFTFNDTVYKFRGPATVLFYDDCESIDNWSGSSAWGVSNEVFYAGNGSITESPNGNYSLFMNDYLELNQEIDLSNYGYAFLSLKMRYAIENTHDYCQIQVSNDGGSSWHPLCTKHSRVGSDDQDEGQPVYTGIVSDWLTDKASLNNYLGQTIKIRFHFWSDQSNNLDGFYFDEFYVIGFDNNMLGSPEPFGNAFSVFPNPATGSISIEAHEQGKIMISDMSGRLVYEAQIGQGTHTIDVSGWMPGMYSCRLLGSKTLIDKILKL
ncbi:MAG TPA: immune inhibitor A, partial [Bacteroidales bacterium]|nr:immune inhibitor A [Bacteroidales bacterium]